MQIFFVKFFLRGYEMEKFKSVDKLVSQLKPSNPVYCIRGNSLKKASNFFQKSFKGRILYAVKTNPNKFVLKTLFDSGIKNFDIASIKEIQTIKEIAPKATCHYMNTVKSRESIKEAYFKYGIKSFSLDLALTHKSTSLSFAIRMIFLASIGFNPFTFLET